jgi:methyl-accepting chemotaxis protein
MARLSLGKKLYLSFGVVLALMLVTGVIASLELKSVERRAHTLYSVGLKSEEKAGSLRRDALQMRGEILSYIVEPDASQRPAIKAKIAKLQAAIAADLSALRAQPGLTAKQQSLLTGAGHDLATWYAARDKGPIGKTDAGDHAGAIKAALHGKGGAAFKAAFATVVAFSKVTNQESANQNHDATATAHNATLILFAVLALAILLGAGIAYVLSRGIQRSVAPVLDRLKMLQDHCTTELRAGLGRLAEGDLTYEVTPVTPLIDNPGGDEIGQIATAVNGIRERTVASVEAYNASRESLRGLVGEMMETSVTVAGASQQMATTSDEAGRAVGEIAKAVSDVASGAERQARMIEQARQSTEASGQAAGEASSVARQGVEAAEKATHAMDELRQSTSQVTTAIRALADKSDEIGGIVETITGIASQTNLLALNAAIEAARAGESGRGFAVVAEEVRKLAEESQEAAASIARLIDQIQSETERTVQVIEDGARRTVESSETVEAAREAFGEIGRQVEEMSERIAQIVEATTEVASVAEQTSASSEEVSASTEQTSASTEQIAASAQELASTADRLQTLVGRFKVAA